MEQRKIDRINALAKKAKATGLTQAETQERDQLRREYIAAFRASLTRELEQVRIVEKDGTMHKLKKKK